MMALRCGKRPKEAITSRWRIGIIEIFGVAERLKQAHRPLLLRNVFGMLERHVEKRPAFLVDEPVGAGIDGQFRLAKRQSVRRKRKRCVPIDIPRKLIEDDDGRKPVFGAGMPGPDHASRQRQMRIPEAVSDFLIQRQRRLEPLFAAAFFEPKGIHLLRCTYLGHRFVPCTGQLTGKIKMARVPRYAGS